MTNITILKQDKGQKIPRPFNVACSLAETAEVLSHWLAMNTGPKLGRLRRAKEAAERSSPGLFSNLKNIDTEQPIFEFGTTKFYGFRN